jgi:hypothetical protein
VQRFVTFLGVWASVIAAAGLAVVVACALVGCGGSGHRVPLTRARFPAYGLVFDYPSSWRRFDCQRTTSNFTASVTLLTTARPAAPHRSSCAKFKHPRVRLGRDGLSVSWGTFGMPVRGRVARFPGQATTIGGQPARIEVVSANRSARWLRSDCPRMSGRRALWIAIEAPQAADNVFLVSACIRGPDLTPGESAVRRMLDSVRFTT